MKKRAYDHDMTQSLGASYMPKNTTTSEQPQGSGGMCSSMPGGVDASSTEGGTPPWPGAAFTEMRAKANRSGQDQAMIHFGVKKGSLTQPGTPKTNLDMMPPPRRRDDLALPRAIPDAGTGYSTSGAILGGERQKDQPC